MTESTKDIDTRRTETQIGTGNRAMGRRGSTLSESRQRTNQKHSTAFLRVTHVMDLSATKTTVHSTFQKLVNGVKPIPTVSTFLQEGDLTLDEGRLSCSGCPVLC